MSDHTIGLVGLALALISVIAPFRWPKMHRAITDMGLVIGCILIGIAVAPYVVESQPQLPLPWVQTLTLPPKVDQPNAQPTSPKPREPRESKTESNQKTVDDLQNQLAVAKADLASTKDELEKTKDLLGMAKLVRGWGINAPLTFWMQADTSEISKYKNSMKLMLIIRAMYSNVDKMTDKDIFKSGTYRLTNGVISLSFDNFGKMHKTPDGLIPVEFDLIGLPLDAEPDQIRTLADVEPAGGQILDAKMTYMTTGHGSSSNIVPLGAIPR